MAAKSAQYWREHYELDSLPYDRPVDVANGYVVRVRKAEYCLHAHANKDRARWGTAAEIAEDIAHIETHGVLPKANGGRW